LIGVRRLLSASVVGVALALPAVASGARQALPPTPRGGGLNAVQCSAVDHCLAVGGSARGVLVDRLSGRTWSLVPAPNPRGSGHAGPTLNGLSCIGSNWCLAVGSNRCDGPLAERWNGRRWSLVNVDLPACDENVWPVNGLTSVSCATRSFCMAVDSTDGDLTDALVTWNGRSWRTWHAFGGKPAADYAFGAASCAALDACAVVGASLRSSASVVGRWNGHGWRLHALDDGVPAEGSGSGMEYVSCPTVGFCMAVGSGYSPDGGPYGAAAIAWNGSGWGRETFPPPIANPDVQSPILNAVGVSCVSRTACVAVSPPLDSDTSPLQPWLGVFNGSRWKTASSAFHAYPKAISCPASGWCMVVGYLLKSSGEGPLTPAAASVS
jgi:hypothetical protein